MKRRILVLFAVLLLAGCTRPAAPGGTLSASGTAAGALPRPTAVIPDASSARLSGAFVLDGGERELLDAKYDVSEPDVCALLVQNGGVLTLRGADVNKTGDAGSPALSAATGSNAAVSVIGGSALLDDPILTTNGLGASAVFVSGDGARITLSDGFLVTNRDASAGLTAGRGAIVEISGSDIVTEGEDSPGVYALGDVSVADSSISAAKSPAAVTGAGSLRFFSSTLIGTGIELLSDDTADVAACAVTLENGALTATADAPLFLASHASCSLSLKNVLLTFASGDLLSVTSGALSMTAENQQLSGRIVCEEEGTLSLALTQGSSMTCCIEAALPQSVSLSLDADSVWNVTADSYIGALADGDATLANIVGNGFTVFYDSGLEANAWLQGKPYALTDGGYLVPRI